MKLTQSQIYVLVLGILALIIAVVTNIATNHIPESMKPYLWYSWPLLILLFFVFLALSIMSEKDPHPSPSPEFNVKRYFEALRKRYQTLDLDALTPPQKEEYLQLQLKAVFVEQLVRESAPPIELPKEILEKLQQEGHISLEEIPEGVMLDEITPKHKYFNSPKEPVIQILTDRKNKHSVILGDPGSGKSTLGRYLVVSLVVADGDERIRKSFPECLPILIELRTFNALREEQKCDTFLEYLEYLGKTEGWHLSQEGLHESLTSKNSALVVFDGLDEIFDSQDRERVSHAIAAFAATYPNSRVVVTSRIIGYQRRILMDAGFSHYTLQDLERPQVELFVKQWYQLALSERPDDAKSRETRILLSFDQSASIRQLAGNPMLLTIMAIIGKHQELPRERWKLYDHAASVLIEHWDVKRHLENLDVEAPFIGEEDKKELLRRLAFRMQAGVGGLKGNYVHRDQLHSEFENYLIERFAIPVDRATTISRNMIEQFRKRNFILSLYGASLYGFVHRAFLEYFCATAFIYKFEKSRELGIEDLERDVFGKHWREESWHEVLRLTCGMLDERFSAQVINYLLNLNRTRLKESVEDVMISVELAMRCFAEIRNLNLLSEPAILALKVFKELFEYLMTVGSSAFSSETSLSDVLQPIMSIGRNWPGRAIIVTFLKEFNSLDHASDYAEEFGTFVGSLGTDIHEVPAELHRYAKHDDANFRVLWPLALAREWPNDNTFELLKNQALNDLNKDCRAVAITAVGRYYPATDARLRELMEDRIKNDTEGLNRFRALVNLPDFTQRPAIKLLTEALVGDNFEAMRLFAAFLLMSHDKDPEIYRIILLRASEDPSPWIRSTICTRLAKQSADANTRNFLYERAIKDPAPEVRTAVIDAIDDIFIHDEAALELLGTIAKEDSDKKVREKAAAVLENKRVETANEGVVR